MFSWEILVYILFFFFFLKILLIYLERGEGKEKERERKINVWLLLKCPQLGIWPATQACALTGNRTGNPLIRTPALNPLSYTSQGWFIFFVYSSKSVILCWTWLHTYKNILTNKLVFYCLHLLQISFTFYWFPLNFSYTFVTYRF